MPFLLALDQGTTSSRSIVFDELGTPRGVAQREFRQFFPRSGWVEHDPEEIWSTQSATIAEAIAIAAIPPREIVAVGITNQRETTIVWDARTGRAIAPAIVWQDRRTAPLCETLRSQGLESLVRERTGLLLDPYFSATKIRWILDHIEGARRRAEAGELRFGTVDSWLTWKLTRGARHVTDPSNAARTMLYDIHRADWCDELLAAFDIPRSLLPEVVPSSGIIAPIVEPSALAGIPLSGIAGDQQAALAGQGAFREGDAKCTYGTGCFLLVNTADAPRPSSNRLLTTVAWRIGGERCVYALEGSVFVGGALVQWLRDGLGVIKSSADIRPLAASVPDSGGVFIVPAFAGLGAPHWDPTARGLIHGLTRGSTAAHIARAALEAIAFQVADLTTAIEADAGQAIAAFRVDGGAAADDLLMQIQADLLERPIERPQVLETTALGAAYLAGLAVGVWPSTEALRAQTSIERTFEPSASRGNLAERRAGWAKAVERAKHWID